MEWGLRSGISDEVPDNATAAGPGQSVVLLARGPVGQCLSLFQKAHSNLPVLVPYFHTFSTNWINRILADRYCVG